MKKSSNTMSSYRESLSGDVGKRYDEKTAVINVDPYTLAKDDFDNDRNSWPEMTNMDIIQFLVYKESAYSKDQLKNYKSLDAYKYFQDGWVQQVLHKQINGVHLIRAKVHHSMRIREKPLEPWLIVHDDGSVQSAHCTCMAGLGECCSHVAATMFALETSARMRQEATVTDVPAYWLYPTSAKFDAPFKRLREMDFQSATKKRKLQNCPPTADIPSKSVADIPSPTKNEENIFFEELSKVLPNSAILSLTDKFCENFKPKSASENWPQELSTIYDPDVETNEVQYEEVLEKCEKIKITVSQKQVKYVESQTRRQAESAMWFRQRCGRVTASCFHACCHTDVKNPSVSLLKRVTSNTKKMFVCAATEWGKKKEKAAKETYRQEMEKKHSAFKLDDSGLCLSETHFQFAASPDGLIQCDCCGLGCVEIKCPYTMRDKNKLDLKWIVENEDGKRLNTKHAYYYQVQMQMHVTNRDYCDFVVWSPNDIYMERIARDEDFWQYQSERALLFHKKCVMPELLCKFFTEKKILGDVPQVDRNVTVTETDESIKYCVCQGHDDGRKMIMCENENCEKQWFHLACIKMKRVPKGKWICNDCKN